MLKLTRIFLQIQRGAKMAPLLLVACSDGALDSSDRNTGGRGGAGMTTGVGGTGGAPPMPKDFRLACYGERSDFTKGIQGTCCDHLICRPPESDGTCPSSDGKWYGNGQCLCDPGGDPESRRGPYASDPDSDAGPGQCCYVTAAVACTGGPVDGRPLHVSQGIRVPTVITRGDWC